ncbi:hypothetical protein PENTCL1PPCAC_7282, partial [Pristionchus entomophagus]
EEELIMWWESLTKLLESMRREAIRLSTDCRIAPESAAVIALFLGACLLLMVCLVAMLCCRSRRRMESSGEKREQTNRRSLFSLMFARLDEFDSLTPLIITPSSASTTHSISIPPGRERSLEKISPRSIVRNDRSSSNSPPPPRRPISAKTLIVPLNASRYRSPVVPLLGTPDSRVTSFETGTTKSCATIPEDDEECEGVDLVSIDRTSFSCSTEVKSGSRYHIPGSSSYNLHIPQIPPSFQIPAPTYTPPEPPLIRPSRLRPMKEEKKKERRSPESSSSSSIGSSPGSSVGSASPIDTTGSLSDSFFVIHELERNVERDSDSQSKYQLHRIEEESEHVDDSVMAYSRTEGSIVSAVRPSDCRPIPRSISEQFELMQQKKA